jgi:hypothetical protein
MIRRPLNGAIFQLQAEAGQIDHTGASVKEASELLSRGASSAASITQTGASLSELSKRTGSNANSAQHACRVSAPTVSTAEAAGQEMIRMVAAMTELKKAGSGISTIIRIIDNIAFQIDRCRRSSESRTPMLGRLARNRAVDRRYGSQERRRIADQRSGGRPDDGHHNPRARAKPTRRRNLTGLRSAVPVDSPDQASRLADRVRHTIDSAQRREDRHSGRLFEKQSETVERVIQELAAFVSSSKKEEVAAIDIYSRPSTPKAVTDFFNSIRRQDPSVSPPETRLVCMR